MATVTKQTVRNEDNAQRNNEGDIPEVVAKFVAANPARFMDKPQAKDVHAADAKRWEVEMTFTPEDAASVAWMLWRARLVITWTAEQTGAGRGKPTVTWARAVESGWLKDPLFKIAKARRDTFYAEQEKRKDRMKTIMLAHTGTDGVQTSTPEETARDSSEEKTTRQAETKKQRVQAEKEEKARTK